MHAKLVRKAALKYCQVVMKSFHLALGYISQPSSDIYPMGVINKSSPPLRYIPQSSSGIYPTNVEIK